MFPANFDRYIEVFGGGGWILFGKPPDQKRMEVHNDYNSNLANLFYCVKNRTITFLQELGSLPLNSRDGLAVIRDFTDKQVFDTSFLKEELQLAEHSPLSPEFKELKATLLENTEVANVKRAAAFFKLVRYSYGGDCTSYGHRFSDVRKCFAAIWQASYRLADTVIENKDFEALIRQYDREGASFYCDPSYYEIEGHYAVVSRREDHARLRDALAEVKGKRVISYNDYEFIRELYAGHMTIVAICISNLTQWHDGGCEFPEVIITNYDPGEPGRIKSQQPHLPVLCGEEEDDYYEVVRR